MSIMLHIPNVDERSPPPFISPMSTTLRNRFTVDRKGGTFAVTDNDLAILSLFNRYEYLPSTFIGAMVPWLHPVYIKNRLTILRHELEFLEVPAPSWEAANARYRPAIYKRGKKGTDALRDRGRDATDIRHKKEFRHELGVNLIAASFDIGGKEYSSLSLITKEDILGHKACPASTREAREPFKIEAPFTYKGRNGKQIPVENAHILHDWYPMGICHTMGERTLRLFMPGVEFDRRSEPLDTEDYERSSITKKLCQMLELFKRYDGIDGYQEHYGIPNAVIPFWTINEVHMRSMMRRLHEITEGKGSDRILFGNMSDFSTFEKLPLPTGWALSYDYKRVGFPDFNFLKELKVP